MKKLILAAVMCAAMSTQASAGFGSWNHFDQVWWDLRSAEMSD